MGGSAVKCQGILRCLKSSRHRVRWMCSAICCLDIHECGCFSTPLKP